VTRLENVLIRYNSSECEQQIANGSEHIKWASLPHHALWEILEQLKLEREAFRSVYKEWQEAHDNMVPSLRLVVPPFIPPPLPYRLETKTGFTGVHEMDLSSFRGDPARLNSALASLSGLRSLNLAGKKFEGVRWTTLAPALTVSGGKLIEEGVRTLCSLTSLTCLDLSRVRSVRPLSADVVEALCSLPLLLELYLDDANDQLYLVLSDEALSVWRSCLSIYMTYRYCRRGHTL